LGRKRVLLEDGQVLGTIAPDLDAQLPTDKKGLPDPGSTTNVTIPWHGDEATVFVEHFAPAPELYIVGGTDTAMSLCRLATELGFRVTVIDAREPFARPERFPEAEQVLTAWPEEAFDQLGLAAGAYVISLAHDPKFDVPTLKRALSAGVAYVGAMGSRETCKRRLELLREAGIADTDLQRIRAPVGLNLGGRSPEEIAVAIVAEMLTVRYGRDGLALSAGAGPIHGPAPG
jgi:xanthine dehydrogenase accessory factor